MLSEGIDPGTERGQPFEETTVHDQPGGELIATSYQFGRQPSFSQPGAAEHQDHSQLTVPAPVLFSVQHSEILSASGYETLNAAQVA
jgi:hypothetical protein